MKRRAVALVLALVVITLVGATISLMVMHAGNMARQEMLTRAQGLARVLIDSGVAYVKAHQGKPTTAAAAGRVSLPTEELVSPPAKGQLILEVQNGRFVRMRAVVELGRTHATEELTLPHGNPTTAP
jgi:hypothetical protein